MKKIMFFYPFFYKGGTEIAIKNLIESAYTIFKDYKIYLGYTDENSFFYPFNDLKDKIEIIKVNKNIEVDILICCSPLITAFDLTSNIKRKYTYLWLHSVSCKAKQVFEDYNYLKQMDKIIVVSEYCKKVLSNYNYYDLIKNNIKVIHNIVNENNLHNLANKPVPLNINFPDELKLITIARICYEKGFARNLVLAKALKEKHINFKWYIAGSGYKKEIEQKIIDSFKDFKDNIIFLGFQDNPYNILKNCDYLVHLSDTETWGLTLTEAKILHIPCIVTDFEAAYEQIENNRNGIILSRENTDTYISYIDDIINMNSKFKFNLNNYTYSNANAIELWKILINI